MALVLAAVVVVSVCASLQRLHEVLFVTGRTLACNEQGRWHHRCRFEVQPVALCHTFVDPAANKPATQKAVGVFVQLAYSVYMVVSCVNHVD
jgi:hypothetical protein